jgi:hypothetical protein
MQHQTKKNVDPAFNPHKGKPQKRPRENFSVNFCVLVLYLLFLFVFFRFFCHVFFLTFCSVAGDKKKRIEGFILLLLNFLLIFNLQHQKKNIDVKCQ